VAAVSAAPDTAAAPARTVPLATEAITEEKKNAVKRVASPQARKPWAVSRKYTSSVCALVQRVRNRPVRYPPRPDATSEVNVIHATAETPSASALMPSCDHGETLVSPRPMPRINMINDSAAAANAPASIAPHDTALAAAAGSARPASP